MPAERFSQVPMVGSAAPSDQVMVTRPDLTQIPTAYAQVQMRLDTLQAFVVPNQAVAPVSAPPTSLKQGALAYNEASDTLYYGKGAQGGSGQASVMAPVGGQGFLDAQGYLRANQAITLSGDVTGTGATGIVVQLPLLNGLVAGAYSNVTVNGKGQVTAIRALSYADVTGARGSAPLTAFLKAGGPTTADIPARQAAVVKDTTGGGVRLWYNDYGRLLSVALS